MMMQKTLALTDSQEMGGEAGMDDAAYCATTLHKSSCASAHPSDTETAAKNVQQPGFAHPSWKMASSWTMCH